LESYVSHAPQQAAEGQPASAAPDTTPQFEAINENLNALRGAVEAYLSHAAQQVAEEPAPVAPDTTPQFEAINENLNAMRGAVETYLTSESQKPERPDPAAYLETLAVHLHDSLETVRADIGGALTKMQSNVEAERMDRVSRQVETMQNSMSSLKDLLAQNRDRLKGLQTKLQQDADKEVVMEFSEEMIGNNEALFQAISEQIEQLRQQGGK